MNKRKQSIVYAEDLDKPDFLNSLIKMLFDHQRHKEQFALLMGMHLAGQMFEIGEILDCKTLSELNDLLENKTGLTRFGALRNIKEKFNQNE